jgi:nucleotidyltransferase/DNA polymerase involved in DNA repair
MSVASIVIPHFALRVAVLKRPELDGAPLILGSPQGERPTVLDATPEAIAYGIRPGQGLREAIALCPQALVLSPHPIREHAIAEQILAGLERFSPAVEADSTHPGCYAIDLAGMERLLGPPRQATEQLLATVPPMLRPRAGVATSKFTAWVAAHQARPGTVRVVAPDATQAFLAPAPVTLLPLDLATLRSLERLKIRTLGDLATLPPAAVAARFGPAGRLAWELAQGNDREPVRPRLLPEIVSESLTLASPATSRETLLLAITRLALRAFGRATLRNHHVRQARLQVSIEGGQSWELNATLREPGGHQRVIDALGYRLQDVGMPGPIEAVTVELLGLTDATSQQGHLLGFHVRRDWQLIEASRQLKQRFGTTGLYRVMEVEPWSRLPERRQALIAYDP